MENKLDTEIKKRKRYKKLTEKEYKTLYKDIKKYVDFEFKAAQELTRSEKILIRKYYEAIKEVKLKNKNVIEYAGKKKNIKAVAKSTSSNLPTKRLKRLILPSYGEGAKIKVKETKKKINGKTVTQTQVTRTSKSGAVEYIALNPLLLELSAESEIRFKLAGKRFALGNFAVYDNYMYASFNSVEAAVMLFNKYQNQYKNILPTHIILKKSSSKVTQSAASEVREYREKIKIEKKAEKRKTKTVKITREEAQEFEELKAQKRKRKESRAKSKI